MNIKQLLIVAMATTFFSIQCMKQDLSINHFKNLPKTNVFRQFCVKHSDSDSYPNWVSFDSMECATLNFIFGHAAQYHNENPNHTQSYYESLSPSDQKWMKIRMNDLDRAVFLYNSKNYDTEKDIKEMIDLLNNKRMPK